MKRKKQAIEKIEYEIGSNNVFSDLGFENPEEDILKSDLVGEIAHLIKEKKLTQAQAAEILGVDQPRISSLLRGKLDLFSIEMLMRFLKDLGRDIEILIKPKPETRKEAILTVNFDPTIYPIPISSIKHPRKSL